jgi:hypothetical protein
MLPLLAVVAAWAAGTGADAVLVATPGALADASALRRAFRQLLALAAVRGGAGSVVDDDNEDDDDAEDEGDRGTWALVVEEEAATSVGGGGGRIARLMRSLVQLARMAAVDASRSVATGTTATATEVVVAAAAGAEATAASTASGILAARLAVEAYAVLPARQQVMEWDDLQEVVDSIVVPSDDDGVRLLRWW